MAQKICIPTGRSFFLNIQLNWTLLAASRIRPSEEINSVYTTSALSLATRHVEGWSLTSSIGAQQQWEIPVIEMSPIFMDHSLYTLIFLGLAKLLKKLYNPTQGIRNSFRSQPFPKNDFSFKVFCSARGRSHNCYPAKPIIAPNFILNVPKKYTPTFRLGEKTHCPD